ncbi:MAG: cobalamin biosynthesis protein [Eubacteriales bacterium]|nr:cobalamin biosynthesis protein [Eubacteriales bacterium]
MAKDLAKAGIVYFTAAGEKTALKVAQSLEKMAFETDLSRAGREPEIEAKRGELSPLKAWCKRQFESASLIVFIASAGIAVRSIAPFIESKTKDPAVVVIDECACFTISLLSGHLGGANRLAVALAEDLGSTAVITTATDRHGLLAVDSWALENGLEVLNPEAIKPLSMRVLAGESLSLYTELELELKLPAGIRPTEDPARADILISIYERSKGEAELSNQPSTAGAGASKLEPEKAQLRLCPKLLYLGIGCRKNTSSASLKSFVDSWLDELQIARAALKGIASIDLKAEEEAILDYAREKKLELNFFSAAELNALSGDFTGSDFVQEVTGTDNVCERAASLAAGPGSKLILKKTTGQGVSLAIAQTKLGEI